MLRISGIRLNIDQDVSQLKKAVLLKLRIPASDLLEFNIFRQSVDARKKEMIYFVYTVDVVLKNEPQALRRCGGSDVSITPSADFHLPGPGGEKLLHPPVVVGTGPAGLFAGLMLAAAGHAPLLLERGQEVDTRVRTVQHFWETGELNTESNVQFGEGGAGTFSDGKLTTLIKDPRCAKVLELLVQAGAPEEIKYSYRPHVGTDLLRKVVKNIRQKIIELGGQVQFNCRVTDIVVQNNRLQGLEVNGSRHLDAQVAILALGHSARDTFAMLHQRGLGLTPKPFSLGVRIEHPQALIDRAQYKKFAGHKNLGPADYKLAFHSPGGRSAYTFCMCPGGKVVAASSEDGCVVTNGMSYYARDGKNANSALLVGVTPEDFPDSHPLAGIEFQRIWEQRAFNLGGGSYRAPAQTVGDFLEGSPSTCTKEVEATYTRGVTPGDLRQCLPDYVAQTMAQALPYFDSKLMGFACPEAIMTGVESRSSSPVRMIRDASRESIIRGLYPAGEGAGYAGGIISAAVDGIKTAESIISSYAPAQKIWRG